MITLHEMEQITLDRQLATAANAVLAIVEEKNGKIALEDADTKQFYAILGLRINGAIVAASGAVIVSNVAQLPGVVTAASAASVASAATPTSLRFASLAAGPDRIRMVVAPLVRQGHRLGAVVLWSPTEWFANIERLVLLASVFTVGIVVAPAIAAGALIAQRGLAPLAYIAEVASAIEAQDLTRRLTFPQRLPEELSRLSVTFNRMLDRLQAAFERERRFTADASHELRAPLAVIAAETDLALRRDRDPAVYQRTLRTIAAVVTELEELTENLLIAARAQPAECGEPIALDAVALQALELLGPLAQERQIHVQADLLPGVLVGSEASALHQAIVAILHNALKFSPEGGHVQVVVTRDTEALVRVSDDGAGFSEQGLRHALERFWRADQARSPGAGFGLGLAIARAIVERAGGRIELANGEKKGAVVTLVFPPIDTRGRYPKGF